MSRAIVELLADRVESVVAGLDPGSVMAKLHPALLEALEAAWQSGHAEGSQALERYWASVGNKPKPTT